MVLQRHLERLSSNDLRRVSASGYGIAIGMLRDVMVHSLRAIVATVVKGKWRGTDLTWSIKSIAVEILNLPFAHRVSLI